MVCPYLKNKGSAVRFCLWPLGFWLLGSKTAHTSAHTYIEIPYKHWNDIRDICNLITYIPYCCSDIPSKFLIDNFKNIVNFLFKNKILTNF